MDLLDVLSEQFFEVSQATVNLWHTVTTAIKQIGSALLECAAQTLHRILRAIDFALEGLLQPIHSEIDPVPQVIRVVHKTIGRIRLKHPRLSSDTTYTDQIRRRLDRLPGIQNITINSLAASIAICFDPNLPTAEMEQQILAAVGQAV